MSSPDPLLRAEFDAFTARAGLVIPAERDAAMFESFLSQRRLFAIMHQPFAYSDEPAYIGGIAR